MADLVMFGESLLRLSTDPGRRLETAGALDLHVGGPESNAAVAAAQLGLEPVWLSKLPESPAGHRVVRELHSHGVRTGITWGDPDEHRMGTYYLERAGEPRGEQVLYDRSGTAAASTTPDDIPLEAVEEAEVCYISGVTPAISEDALETTAAILEAAREAGTTVAFAVHYREQLWPPHRARGVYQELLPHVDVLFAGRQEAVEVLETAEQPVKIANGLRSRYDCRTVVVTRGHHGVLALHGGEVHEQEALEVETIDDRGCEDALVGAFLAARIRGDGIQRALRLAAAAWATKRTVSGDILVSSESELERVAAAGEDDDLFR